MGDMIPGKGKNKYSNFILYLGGIEALKAKTKAKLIEEKGSINPVDEQVDNHEEADSLKANPDLDNAHQSSLIDGDD